MRAPSVWGIAGSPIDHSITPALFRTVGETLGMASIETIALDVENAEELLRYLSEREGDIWLSCTSPIKHSLHTSIVDQTHPASSFNQIMKKDNTYKAANTDGRGFIIACREMGLEPSKASIMIRGGGSTARSVALEWSRSGGVIVPVGGRRELGNGPWTANIVSQNHADLGVDFDASPGNRDTSDMDVTTKVSVSYGNDWSVDDFAIRMVVAQHLLSWEVLYAPDLCDALPSVAEVCALLSAGD